MKKILYLVQSREKFIKKNLALETSIADVIILTFQKEHKESHFIFLPNSNWYEGRNALYEKAKSLSHQYEYYIFLDDDILFDQGDFSEFEKDLLIQKSHLMAPLYKNVALYRPIQILKLFYSFQYFPISKKEDFDMCFIALSKELFFNKKILPYNTLFIEHNFFAGNMIFKLMLFHLYKKDETAINCRIIIDNAISEVPYNQDMNIQKVYDHYLQEYLLKYIPAKSLKEMTKSGFSQEKHTWTNRLLGGLFRKRHIIYLKTFCRLLTNITTR